MAAGGVGVAVLDFFGGGFANFAHRDVEVQSLASQRVVGVNRNRFVIHRGDNNNPWPLGSLGLKLRTNRDIAYPLQIASSYLAYLGFVTKTIGLLRLNDGIHLVARRFAVQRCFKARDNVASAVQIREGLSTFRTVENLSL